MTKRPTANFADVVAVAAGFAVPVFEAVTGQRECTMVWRHPGPWARV